MAENENSISISSGIRLTKKVISCMFLLKKMEFDEETKLTRYINFPYTYLITVGVVLTSFYGGLPIVINQYGYMIFFPLLLSGMMSLITSVCFAELVCLNPNSGGSYRYVYYTMGEFAAFLVGWSCLYSSFLGLVAVTGVMTKEIDVSLFNGSVANFTLKNFHIGGLENYFLRILPNAKLENIFVLLALTVTSCYAVRYGSIATHIMASFNIILILFCLIIFWFYMDLSKFNILGAIDDFSFITVGALKGHLFYMNFEISVFSGAESINPTFTIPTGLIEGFQLGFMIYMASVILYSARKGAAEQNSTAPAMQLALWNLGFRNFSMLLPIGHILCHYICGIAALYKGSRVMYTMAKDGLIFPMFSHVHAKLRNTINAHIFMAITCYLVSVFIGVTLNTQVSVVAMETMIRIMVLLAYLLTRYGYESEDLGQKEEEDVKMRWSLTNWPEPLKFPTKTTRSISRLLIFLTVISFISAEFIVIFYIIRTKNKQIWLRLCFVFSLITAFISIHLLNQQPINDRRKFLYEVRGVPYTPILAIAWYTLILMLLPPSIWVKIICWLIIGSVFYFSYASLRSKEYIKQKGGEAGESSPDLITGEKTHFCNLAVFINLVSSMHTSKGDSKESWKPEIIDFYVKTKGGIDALDFKSFLRLKFDSGC